MNIAPSVIATMSTVVRTEARAIFIRLARRSEAAGRRIAQLDGNQNPHTRPRHDSERPGKRFKAQRKPCEVQRKPDQSSATRIESLGLEGSYFTLAGWPATSRSKRICPSRPVMSCAV